MKESKVIELICTDHRGNYTAEGKALVTVFKEKFPENVGETSGFFIRDSQRVWVPLDYLGSNNAYLHKNRTVSYYTYEKVETPQSFLGFKTKPKIEIEWVGSEVVLEIIDDKLVVHNTVLAKKFMNLLSAALIEEREKEIQEQKQKEKDDKEKEETRLKLLEALDIDAGE